MKAGLRSWEPGLQALAGPASRGVHKSPNCQPGFHHPPRAGCDGPSPRHLQKEPRTVLTQEGPNARNHRHAAKVAQATARSVSQAAILSCDSSGVWRFYRSPRTHLAALRCLTTAKGFAKSSKLGEGAAPPAGGPSLPGQRGVVGGESGFVSGVNVKRRGLHLQTLVVTINCQCGVGRPLNS